MKTNDIKKGMKFRLNIGWEAVMLDNAKGNTRLAEVYGDFTECGSVYAHDIVEAQDANGQWHLIEHTPAQLKLRKTAAAFGW